MPTKFLAIKEKVINSEKRRNIREYHLFIVGIEKEIRPKNP